MLGEGHRQADPMVCVWQLSKLTAALDGFCSLASLSMRPFMWAVCGFRQITDARWGYQGQQIRARGRRHTTRPLRVRRRAGEPVFLRLAATPVRLDGKRASSASGARPGVVTTIDEVFWTSSKKATRNAGTQFFVERRARAAGLALNVGRVAGFLRSTSSTWTAPIPQAHEGQETTERLAIVCEATRDTVLHALHRAT